MELTTHNPSPWLEHFGFNHAVEVRGADRTLYCSGQTASDAQGAPLHPGDLVAQYRSAWDNLVTLLAAADMTPANLVRLNIFTTDVPAFMDVAETLTGIHVEAGAQVACTLIGVGALYAPEVLVEIEATAVAGAVAGAAS
ncbi:RidA-family enamine deaminase [Erythrobacter litoralis]|jgi:enamine deaminase RidA (YjgF/YER057c/UK114 family)|uniref:Endoribonuclease n=1 Tax=Erythrobacter litoralis TaxID=39960 RepID=A0A074MN86_9SPHN|nr:RidA family protein [Erythrobacter litoralis]AOL24927.1 RidA-family enamine deaminase [Erythrobacter litoralis]KEO96451.1 endoribonuclease [Erythrobacter litoralis]MEE4338788.1 RidA family protein [Erythrobacter sp.]